MTTRTLFSICLIAVLSVSRGFSQAAPEAAAPEAPAVEKPAAPAPAAPAQPEIAIKDDSAPKSTATKGKDAAGHDTLSVDFPDEDIRNILRNVADLFELNLVIPETLQGKASIKLRDVSWRQIFHVVLQPIGYTYIEEGNIIKIVSNESLALEPVTTEIFIINYARANEIQSAVQSLVSSPGSKIVVDARSNSLVITETPSRLVRIRPIIEQLDRATDQVMIESKFVEVTDGDIRNLGVNWASLSGYKVGVGAGGENNQFGTYDRTQNQNRSAGSSGSNGTTNSSTNGTTGNTSNSATTNATQGSGSTTSNTVTVTNGSPNAVSQSGTTGSLTTTTTTIGSSGTGTTSATSNAVTDSLNLLNSLTNGGTTERALSAVFTADQFGVILSALNQFTKAKVVSNPTIVTLNNTEATINIGKDYPLPNYTYSEQKGSFEISGFTYRSIGINLKVTPQVNARGFVKLTIDPEVSSTTSGVPFGGASGTSIPIIDTKKAHTQISMRDGSTMGIGGLINTQLTNGETKVPLLGSIPGLGYLFKQKTKNLQTQNLLIFLTAKVLPAEGATLEQVFDPRQIREMNLRRDELPGYRDGSDPFGPDPAAVKKSGKKE